MGPTVDSCPQTVKTDVGAVSWSAGAVPTAGKKALIKERFLFLVEELRRDLGSPRKPASDRRIARHLSVDPSYLGKVRDDPKRFVGLDVLAKIETHAGVAERFFTDAALGARPDYRKHLVGTRAPSPTASPYPAFNAYIEEELAAGRMTETHARDLRHVRIPGTVTWGMASSLHREMIARDRTIAISTATPRSGIKSTAVG
jgi:hypothetical protein